MGTSSRAALTERAAATLLERALGAPALLVAYDPEGRPLGTWGAGTAPALTAEQHAALAEGREVELEAGGAQFSAVGSVDAGGLLWAALRPADDLRALPRFTHHLVHQLRNALSSLKLAAQSLARAAGLNEREHRRADIALREVARMERVLSTATEFVVGAPGRVAPLSPVEAVQAAAAALGPELAARGLTLQLALDAAPPKLEGDVARLELAVQNLLAHAARVLADGAALTLTLDSGSAGHRGCAWSRPARARGRAGGHLRAAGAGAAGAGGARAGRRAGGLRHRIGAAARPLVGPAGGGG